jgi:tetratricopeptide (TPR) repeat protein
MAESTCLHIQDRESGPIRIVEIPWISVRIGRAAFCEVRLTDPELADEACRLHRRGRTWYLTPIAAGAAVVDGRPVAAAQPLPFDTPFRVGPFLLALKRNKFAEPDWRPPRAAPNVEAKTPPRPTHRPQPQPQPQPRSRAEAYAPRPRPTPAADSAASNPWEARWKAAGDRLKAANADKPTPTVPPRAGGYAPPRPTPAAAPSYPTPSAPSSKFEPAGFTPRPVPSPTPADAPVRPSPAVETPAPANFEAPHDAPVEVEARTDALIEAPVDVDLKIESEIEVESEATAAPSFFDSMSDPVAWAAEAPDEASDAVEIEAEDDEFEVPSFNVPVDDEVEVEDKTIDIVLCDDEPAPCDDEPSLYEASSFSEEQQGPTEWTFSPTVEHDGWAGDVSPRFVADTSRPHDESDRVRSWARAEAERQERREREQYQERQSAPDADSAQPSGPPEPARGSALRFDRGARHEDDRRERFDPTRAPRSREERAEPALPSVQDVLTASQWTRQAPSPASAALSRPRPRPRAVPTPTTAVAPAQWTLPSWLTWPPATFLSLTIGAVFTLCSWWWTVDSKNAAIAGQSALAMRRGGAAMDRPLPNGVEPPPTSWWRTTPLHLAQWSAYLSGTRLDHGWTENPSDLIGNAAAMAPLNPVARLARARMGRPEARPANPTEALGLSRDAVSLAWTAQGLHKAGKNEAAIRAYRRAFEIAGRSTPEHDGPLVFSDDPNAPRYLLPGEDLVRPIVAELISDPSWTYREWSAAIPKGTVAALVTAKGLKELGRSEADLALKDLVDALKLEPVDADAADDRPATVRAVAHAVAAEALMLRASWQDARTQYRAAIELMADAKIKRSWWFNLADVAARLNDEQQRRDALDAVLAAVDGDEVSRRALDVQRADQPLGRLRSNGPKAN